MAAKKKSTPLLSRLRGAIQKVSFLLSFDATTWIVSSIKRSSPGPRPLSFKTRPSLLDCTDDYYSVASSLTLSRTSSLCSPAPATPTPELQMSRSITDASSYEDDVDQRAEMFIENFHRRLRMERQVSLELSYCRKKSLERTALD